ncbi:MAG: choline dehydrogenase [Panacagrimonas sp.]|nr:GMC family oxidoreductase [Panacagrimonas sp.]MCC2658708.1 choline dehydrogenase [Panacagrimonas sp.]
MNTFDYVIVGGGTAASILAYRLGEKGHSVCVVEAGPEDRNPYIRMPVGWFKTLKDPRVTWQLQYQGSEGTLGRVTPLVQGKVLGGSSAVNGAVYNRGQKEDFDTWAELGNPGWGYADVLPYFRRSERLYGAGDDRFRGRDGPMPVNPISWRTTVGETFLEGAKSIGIPESVDYNGEVQTGVNYTQGNVLRNRRWSTAHAFLHPARSRFNVEVLTGATVTRVVLDGRRATGVEYRRGDEPRTRSIAASRAVVLCAGAIGSPKLLQLSGIGPAAVLGAAGVAVHSALEGVGENLRDHFVPRVIVRCKPHVVTVNERVKGFALMQELVRWAIGRPSVLAISPVLIYGFWKSRPELARPDIALSYFPASYKLGMIGHLDDKPGLTCGGFQLRPESQGYVRVRSASDRDAPEIQPNFLAHETDRSVVVAALKCARSIMHSVPMQRLVESEMLPGPDVQTDDQWLQYARRYGSTGYHPIGTCRMGDASDPRAVVDPRLKVHGHERLYVMDASVMPTLVSANTAAATMMIAEKGADLLGSGT